MQTGTKTTSNRRLAGPNVWLAGDSHAISHRARPARYEVFATEEEVGRAMFDELVRCAEEKEGDITILLLGGRGAQAMYRIINEKALAGEINHILGRLNVFTQDALAPMRMGNGLSFVRDFERLLGDVFFSKVKSFTPMNTEADDLEQALTEYLEKLEATGGIDIFFLGLGPEAEAASHLCYIKPNSGARLSDMAGMIAISASILEHHISKFRAGGSVVSEGDERECRNAKFILTLGPGAILGARRIVQSIVDASTAPAKKAGFRRVLETEMSEEPSELARQIDENPGLLPRLHANVRTLVLPDLLEE